MGGTEPEKRKPLTIIIIIIILLAVHEKGQSWPQKLAAGVL
jgi:hypothetical protein